MKEQSKIAKNSRTNLVFSVLPFLLISFLISCSGSGEPAIEIEPAEKDSIVIVPFPDSTNLQNATDSLRFAELCIFDHDRNDIADRYFRAIVRGWNPKDSCNEAVSGSFRWMGWEERRRSNPDTTLIFAWLDSSILACPSSSHAYSGYGSMLLEFERSGAEPYFNLAVKNGADQYHISECIRGHYDIVDTNKLTFDWMDADEMRMAADCSGLIETE